MAGPTCFPLAFAKVRCFRPRPGSFLRAKSRGLAGWERTAGGTVHFTLREAVKVSEERASGLAGWLAGLGRGRRAGLLVQRSGVQLLI